MVGRENVYFWVFEENRFIIDLLELVPRENVLVIRAKKPVTLLMDLLRTAWQARRASGSLRRGTGNSSAGPARAWRS